MSIVFLNVAEEGEGEDERKGVALPSEAEEASRRWKQLRRVPHTWSQWKSESGYYCNVESCCCCCSNMLADAKHLLQVERRGLSLVGDCH